MKQMMHMVVVLVQEKEGRGEDGVVSMKEGEEEEEGEEKKRSHARQKCCR